MKRQNVLSVTRLSSARDTPAFFARRLVVGIAAVLEVLAEHHHDDDRERREDEAERHDRGVRRHRPRAEERER